MDGLSILRSHFSPHFWSNNFCHSGYRHLRFDDSQTQKTKQATTM